MTRALAPRHALRGRAAFVCVALLAMGFALMATGCRGGSSKTAATPAGGFKVTSLDALKPYRFSSDILVSSEALDPQMAQTLL